jgi:hypothetical protein
VDALAALVPELPSDHACLDVSDGVALAELRHGASDRLATLRGARVGSFPTQPSSRT